MSAEDWAHRTYVTQVEHEGDQWSGEWVARCYHCPWESDRCAWFGLARNLADRHVRTYRYDHAHR